jgi:hypothetical protein
MFVWIAEPQREVGVSRPYKASTVAQNVAASCLGFSQRREFQDKMIEKDGWKLGVSSKGLKIGGSKAGIVGSNGKPKNPVRKKIG